MAKPADSMMGNKKENVKFDQLFTQKIRRYEKLRNSKPQEGRLPLAIAVTYWVSQCDVARPVNSTRHCAH